MKLPQLPPGVTLPGGTVDLLALVAALGVVLAADDLAAVLEVVLVLDLPLVALVVHVADVEEDVLAVGILGDAEHRVGRFALVVPLEATADRHRADRMGLVCHRAPSGPRRAGACPGCSGRRCRSSRTSASCSGRKLPWYWSIIGRAAPEVPVEVGRRIGDGFEADAAARLAAVAVGDLQLAELAGLDRLVQTGDAGVAAAAACRAG